MNADLNFKLQINNKKPKYSLGIPMENHHCRHSSEVAEMYMQI